MGNLASVSHVQRKKRSCEEKANKILTVNYYSSGWFKELLGVPNGCAMEAQTSDAVICWNSFTVISVWHMLLPAKCSLKSVRQTGIKCSVWKVSVLKLNFSPYSRVKECKSWKQVAWSSLVHTVSCLETRLRLQSSL